MEFWGVCIRDLVGLPLKAAALAYGPADAALVAQRAAAFGAARQPVAEATPPIGEGGKPSLMERMARRARPALAFPAQPTLAEAVDAIGQLERHLVDALGRGALVATGQDARGARRAIGPDEWARATMRTDESMVTLGRTKLHEVRVRQAETEPSTAAPAASFTTADVERWFLGRVRAHASAPRHPPEPEDMAAAVKVFPGVHRKVIRDLRAAHVPPERRRQGPSRKG